MSRKLFASLLGLLLLAGAALAQDTGIDPVYQALSSGNVYVDPSLTTVNPDVLGQAAMQGQGNPHTRVKIAVLANLPGQYRSRNDYASGLHRNLGLEKDALVLVVLSGRQAGVEVITQGLGVDEENRLARQYAPSIRANPTDGTAALAQAVAGDINGKEYRSSAWLWIVFLVVVAVIAGLIISASRRKKSELVAARAPIQALRGNVLSGIEYLDGYVDTLPKNNPDSDQVRIFRQAASAKFDQAVKILDRATEMTDLNRAQALLDQAQADVQQSRRYLDRVTGGTANIPGDDAVRPQPLPDSQPDVERIPANQRGVSFFSSQPAPLSSLLPVTVTINNQSRQVLVTPEEANELRQGRMPHVLAFQESGRYVPWYEYNGYDPYRDYWHYQNAGWGGFGTGLVAGFIGMELMDSMFMPSYGMGYSPYAYATDMPMYQGYADPGYAGGGAGDGGGGGGADFGAGDSNFPTDNSADYGGGADFGGGNDGSSGSDYGGGADFGGGGDFGGGDFGGGGGSDF